MSRPPSDKADQLRAPTVARDGSRRWLYPERRPGPQASRRRALAIVLILIYLLVPFLSIGGQPLLRIGFDTGLVSVFGQSFRFSETYFLAFGAITLGFAIVRLCLSADRLHRLAHPAHRGAVGRSGQCPETS